MSIQAPGVPVSEGLARALRRSMTRDELFAGLCFLGCVNGLGGRAIQSIYRLGWWAALLNSFDTSAIVWFACCAGLLFILRGKQQQIRSADLAVAAGSLILITLPTGGGISWLAVTGLSVYMLLSTGASMSRHRGAVILLVTTVPMLWTGLAFRFFTNSILNIDASLVAWVLGTGRLGNTVRFADDSGYMTIWPPCSSLVNAPYALLTWVVIGQMAGRRWGPRGLLWSGGVCAAVIAANVMRLSLMGLGVDYYAAIHNQWGDAVVNLIALGLAVGISVFGVRRELLSRP